MFHVFFVCGKDTKVDALIVKLDVDLGCSFFYMHFVQVFFTKGDFFKR
jgi:hypothetical protein